MNKVTCFMTIRATILLVSVSILFHVGVAQAELPGGDSLKYHNLTQYGDAAVTLAAYTMQYGASRQVYATARYDAADIPLLSEGRRRLKQLLRWAYYGSAIQENLKRNLVLVKGGCFQMGDNFGDGFRSERPVHEVCVDSFYMGKYEVTQQEWYAVMGWNPSYFKRCNDCPVDSVTWNDTQAFIRRLNDLTGMKYRLPTEAEWEYAARSGGRRERWAGTSSIEELGVYAWYDNNSSARTHPVGEKRANRLGFYDMSGNVSEWVQDWYANVYYSKSPRDNPSGASSGVEKVLRGGSFSMAKFARTANRGFHTRVFGFRSFGLRLSLSAQE